MNSMDASPTADLKTVIDSEWDILQALCGLMKQLNEQPKLEWVSSHQDDDQTINNKKLPIGTQLNIESDTLVTKGLQCLHPKSCLPLDQSLEVLLHHDGRVITKDLKRALRSVFKLPVLEKYYMNRFNWTLSQYQKIEGEIFTPVFCQQTNKNLKWMNKFG